MSAGGTFPIFEFVAPPGMAVRIYENGDWILVSRSIEESEKHKGV